MQCRITVLILPSGEITAVDTGTDVNTVLNRLADRTSRSVLREVQMRRDQSRRVREVKSPC